MKNMIRVCAGGMAAFLFCLLCSCSFTSSTNVDTSGIWMSYVVEHQSDSNIQVRAYARVGGPFGTLITMASGESLTCNGVTLTRGILYYYTQFNAPAAGGSYEFVFHRVSEDVATTVTMPASPDAASTDPTTDYNEWDPLDVYWNASGSQAGDTVEIDISGAAVSGFTRSSLPDNGSYTVNSPPGTGLSSPDNSVAGPITVSVRRVRSGSVNAAFQGGSTSAERWAGGVVIPNFQPKLTLSLSVSPAASGTVTSTGSVSGTQTDGATRRFQVGEQVTLTPVPTAGWTFYNWSGDIGGSDNPHIINSLTGNTSVTAAFGP
ncbi:MAG: hypothetical protein JXD23_01905 [Spirochaetales bacterium]|nr:hypothetical protein [Spirochaetales bacterium]